MHGAQRLAVVRCGRGGGGAAGRRGGGAEMPCAVLCCAVLCTCLQRLEVMLRVASKVSNHLAQRGDGWMAVGQHSRV